MLVTSSKGDRWGLPKGWPKRHEPFAAAAMREAVEEAGVIGTVYPPPLGEFTYRKTMRKGYVVRSHVFVFALQVLETLDMWREDKRRSRKWVPLGDAAGIVGDRDVARLLTEIAAGDTLHTVLAELDAARAAAPDIQPNSC
ncbi:MAG: NUDIX hydrolase [Rhodospirillaceae bacterium]|jgi:hypothetical protein|nr:NUDIX hydrolase [Rhodospirillaceae bacterium]MBT3809922.1 NUDIX hydrolase [Rhodospirillaceae bacterium]MBT4772849.1 NUDIX hydrolase [Rhodospirillaceae bacterium]MBT5360098.1 NUDIX hydrolase [Rhodospirillaceae bacterium]MBT5770919.1 NUDIX hydrolase [Rhodospirillaceae bacterium]